jgi:hypothetical protein
MARAVLWLSCGLTCTFPTVPCAEIGGKAVALLTAAGWCCLAAVGTALTLHSSLLVVKGWL